MAAQTWFLNGLLQAVHFPSIRWNKLTFGLKRRDFVPVNTNSLRLSCAVKSENLLRNPWRSGKFESGGSALWGYQTLDSEHFEIRTMPTAQEYEKFGIIIWIQNYNYKHQTHPKLSPRWVIESNQKHAFLSRFKKKHLRRFSTKSFSSN